jgi:hypothetical protein
VTERYIHLVPGQFSAEDHAAVTVDLSPSQAVPPGSDQGHDNGEENDESGS